jgi:tetratricopeptide (TPR) repeat protein
VTSLPGIEGPSGGASVPAGDDRLQRRAAVLIMVVTLTGAVFAFLQTVASNRESGAARLSDASGVEAMAQLARGGSQVYLESQIWSSANVQGGLGTSLAASAGGQDRAFIEGLAAAFAASREAIVPFTDLADPAFQNPDGTVAWQKLVDQTLRPAYRAAEFQKAYAAERDSWSAKSSSYVAVLTVVAVSLFLIGLSLTVVPGTRRPLVRSGATLAVVAAFWGLTVVLRPVPQPSEVAIDALLEGQVLLNSASNDLQFGQAEEQFTLAIQARPDYREAYLGRGSARFRRDLARPDGPIGTEGGRDDFAAATRLEPLDPLAWGDLGAAEFWLGDMADASAFTRRALELDPGDLTFSLNLGLALSLTEGRPGFEAQLGRIEGILAAAPSWLRDSTITRFVGVLDLVQRFRPDTAGAVAEYEESLVRISHQVAVSRRYFGGAVPSPVAATLSVPSFVLSKDRTRLEVAFDATGVEPGQRWLYRTYLDGVESTALSIDPQAWPFGVPAAQVTVPLAFPDGLPSGVVVRVEFFIEGNLLAAGEYTG